jgi:hypothetical protein
MTTATMTAPTANDFLGDDYQIPSGGSGAGRYLKFEEGKTVHFRILSQKALKGYEYWNVENKPVRLLEKPETTPINIRCDENGKPERMKHFWAMAVWDYGSSSVKLLQITQSTIQNNILGLVRDPDFGHPTKYDLKIARKGKALETEYTVMPLHKPMPEEAIAEYLWNPVYLEALLHGADPFAADSEKYAAAPISAVAPVAVISNKDRLAAIVTPLGLDAALSKSIRHNLLGRTKSIESYTADEIGKLQDALLIEWARQFQCWKHDQHRVNAYHKFVEGLDGVPTDDELLILWKEECDIRVAEVEAAKAKGQVDGENIDLGTDTNAIPF